MKSGSLLFQQLELEGAADRVRGARAELSLVVHRRHLRAQVHARRQRDCRSPRHAKGEVALIGEIRNPSDIA